MSMIDTMKQLRSIDRPMTLAVDSFQVSVNQDDAIAAEIIDWLIVRVGDELTFGRAMNILDNARGWLWLLGAMNGVEKTL